jgi:hypothetical protein
VAFRPADSWRHSVSGATVVKVLLIWPFFTASTPAKTMRKRKRAKVEHALHLGDGCQTGRNADGAPGTEAPEASAQLVAK